MPKGPRNYSEGPFSAAAMHGFSGHLGPAAASLSISRHRPTTAKPEAMATTTTAPNPVS